MSNNKRINNPICTIFDCYYEYDNIATKPRKFCKFCAYDYSRIQDLSDKIRREILPIKNNRNKISLRAKITEIVIILITSFLLAYSVIYFYLKIKH